MQKLILILFAAVCLAAGCREADSDDHRKAAKKLVKKTGMCAGKPQTNVRYHSYANGIVEVRCTDRVFIVHCYIRQGDEDCRMVYRHARTRQP